MKISICVLAKDEAENIVRFVEQLKTQTIFHQGCAIEIGVVANGSTDNTADLAREKLAESFCDNMVTANLHDLPAPGKARAWNRAVHDLLDAQSEIAIFADADIEFADENVLSDLCCELLDSPGALAVSGYPLKDISRKKNKSLIDQFSLGVSKQTPAAHALNGSLYAAYLSELRRIWLPEPTPGEDGMISAMIHTNGFSEPAQISRVIRMKRPTHYFESHSVAGFFRHERRMTVGTVINGWIFEFLWEGKHSSHVGQFIRDKNSENPDWVNSLVADHVQTGRWVLPSRMLFWRLYNLRNCGLLEGAAKAPFSIAATLLNVWPSLQANRILKKDNPAGYW